jgi:hypothetical protein
MRSPHKLVTVHAQREEKDEQPSYLQAGIRPNDDCHH